MNDSSGRILVVDDHARNLAIIQKILGSDHRLATASSGEEALEVARRFLPDVVLLDIMMPGIDGYETCRRMREAPELRRAKIILLSAKATLSERLAGYEAGADDYVVKPFDEDELVVKVRVYLRLKSVEEIEEFKTQVIALLNHETRTPLTTILTPIDLLLSEPERLDEEQRELLLMAQRGAQRLNAFIEGVNLLNEVQSGRMPLDVACYDYAGLVRCAAERLGASAAEKRVTLALGLTEGLRVDGDLGYLSWVIAAILDNALRFSPSGSVVELALDEHEGGARLSIRDQGPGIPESFLGQVFTGLTVPNIQQHQSGRGLSLVTARAIVRRHEGRMQARNLEAGGAEFVVWLPLSPEGRAARPVDGAAAERLAS